MSRCPETSINLLLVLKEYFPLGVDGLVCDYVEPVIGYWKFMNELNLLAVVERKRPEDTYSSYFLRTGISAGSLWAVGGDPVAFLDQLPNDRRWLTRYSRHNNVVFEAVFEAFLWESNIYSDWQDFYRLGNHPIAQLIYQFLGWYYGFQTWEAFETS
jgi:hypothetical protein